jgi:hypothetical protein
MFKVRQVEIKALTNQFQVFLANQTKEKKD